MSLAMQGTGVIPGYSYQYPSNSVRLTAVKRDIFNPRLPSIRQMERDTNMQLLPDEHCRTSTTLGRDDFKRANSSLLQPGKIALHHLPITEQGHKLLAYGPDYKKMNNPTPIQRLQEKWKDDIVRIPNKFSLEMRESLHSREGPTFTGYATRYLRPEITSSWQYTLHQNPSFDQYGQRPIPANVFALNERAQLVASTVRSQFSGLDSTPALNKLGTTLYYIHTSARYRDSRPQYNRDASTQVWN